MQNALTLENLAKTYPTGVEALKRISMAVEEGDFFGLLGPNGAGKSTAIGIITGLVNKTGGRAIVFDKDIDTEFEEAKRLLGVVPQEMNFSIFEKVQDIVVNQAGYYGIPRRQALANAEEYLRQLGLWEKRFSQARTLSGGMKRRLMIARGLVHKPRLLILDEPTAGVDVELRRSMWAFLVELNRKGITIILTTHYLEEAEQLCRNIAIINHGSIIEHTSKKELLAKLAKESYIIDLKRPIERLPELPGYAAKLLDPTTLEAEVSRGQTITALFSMLERHRIEALSMRNKSNRLEELFLHMVEGGHP